jgi:low affinity Fe/Cu permease
METMEKEHPVEEIGRERTRFAHVAHAVTVAAGSSWALAGVLAIGLVWLGAGVAVGFSRTWELFFTAGVPFLTLIFVVIVQHTQNHNNRAIQLKLDELIAAVEGPHKGMVGIEEGSRRDLEHVRANLQQGTRQGPQ